jgi:hypothetical protein
MELVELFCPPQVLTPLLEGLLAENDQVLTEHQKVMQSEKSLR